MKRWILYSFCIWLLMSIGITAFATSPSNEKDVKRVIIMNSYSRQMAWSKMLTDSLEKRILDTYPDWQLFLGNLKTEGATSRGAALITMRSILWSYAKRAQSDSVDMRVVQVTSIFNQNAVPDLLVILGEEAFLNYVLSYSVYFGKWKHVPMVLCAVNDSLSASGWVPERGFDFQQKCGLDDYDVITTRLPLKAPIDEYLKDKEIVFTKEIYEGEPMNRFDIFLNYTSVMSKLPVRENLELIHQLIPNLKELIWVDNNYYASARACLEVEKEIGKFLPGVKYSKMIHDGFNTDSIYDVMLQPAEGRAFLTYSWNIEGLNSKRSDAQIDSLFSKRSTVPLFSLTQREWEKEKYWVGGYYLSQRVMIDKSMALIDRILKDTSRMSVPFDTLTTGKIVLNRTAIERYGLSQAANGVANVQFVHLPPSFFQKYEKLLLIGFLVVVLIIGYQLIQCRRRKYSRLLQTDYDRYKRLYNKLQIIYENSSIDFALYDRHGKRLMHIVGGEDAPVANGKRELFFENIFDSPYLTDHQKIKIRAKRIVNCEIAVDMEGQLSKSNLSEKNVFQLIVKSLQEAESNSFCFIAIAINLTPVMRERREKERFESLFHFASDSAHVGVAFYDVTTAVGLSTASWCQNMNETYASGVFPTYANVMPEDRESLLQYQNDVLAGKITDTFCREIQVNWEDGEIHWVRQYIYYVEKYHRFIELSLNIDQQKQSENKLREAKQKAEQSNEETRDFLSSISHEVRTPLNGIVGFSAVLAVLEDEDECEEYASIITRNNYLLDALITNILDLSELDAGTVTFNYTMVNVSDMFDRLGTYIHSNLYNKHLQIVVDVPIGEEDRIIRTDANYLYLLLSNLLSNAIKFTEEGTITLGCRKEEVYLYFYVKDSGCGISPEDQDRVFNRFEKLDTYAQGTGLGLSLCKNIVEHLGGEIGVVSEKGKGSTFWFMLPEMWYKKLI